jgi:membrane protein DedA with SNARE-associated domain
MVACEALVVEWLLWVCPLLSTLGYPVVFIINLIGSASVFIPIPGFAIIFFMPGLGFDPWLLALFGAAGAAIGEITSYIIGVGGRKIADKRKKEGLTEKVFRKKTLIEKAEEWSKKRGIFPVIILFAATPLPFDIVGLVAGVIRYDAKKFLLATFIGKFIIFSVIAWAGLFGMEWLLQTLAGGI